MYATGVIREQAAALRTEPGEVALDFGRRYRLDCLSALLKVTQKASYSEWVVPNDALAVALLL
jgi:hypothetical protein